MPGPDFSHVTDMIHIQVEYLMNARIYLFSYTCDFHKILKTFQPENIYKVSKPKYVKTT